MTQPAYHHGDLRSALIAAALALLEEQGMAALSLRALARRAGVSAMAPYHHFPTRAALVAAVATAGFDRLYAEKLSALAAAGDDPVERLVAGTRGYVAFVIANPELYRLMASAELADRSGHPALAKSAAAPQASLAALVTAARGAGRLGNAEPGAVAMQLWALAHGLGQLAIDGYAGDADVLALAEAGARHLLAGLSTASISPAA